MKFGERLRTLRIERGLSQKTVATAISVSINAISQYETDKWIYRSLKTPQPLKLNSSAAEIEHLHRTS